MGGRRGRKIGTVEFNNCQVECKTRRNVMAHPIPNSQQGAREIRVAATSPKTVLWLQGITLAWMLVECAVSLYAAKQARSVVLLAFGADSGIELLSAIVALVSFMPSLPITIKT